MPSRATAANDTALLAALFSRISDAALHIGPDGEVRRANARFVEWFAVSPLPPGMTLAMLAARMEESGRLRRPSGRGAVAAALAAGGGWELQDGRTLDLVVEALPDGSRLLLWTPGPDASLAEERARMRHLLDNMTDAVVLMDSDGVILENSTREGRLLGIPDELVRPGRTHADIIRFLYRRGDYGFDLDEDSFVAHRRAQITGAGRHTFAQRMPDGRWVEYQLRPLPQGNLLIIVRDVTELKQALARLEAERAEREEDRRRANLLLDSTQDCVILADAGGAILECSSRAGEVFGLPAELFRPGANYQDILRAMHRRGDFGFGQGEELFVANTRARLSVPGRLSRTRRMPDGSWAELTFTTRDDGQVILALRDVTELKQAQEKLEEEQEKLRLVVENMSDGVMLFDKDLRWRMLSRPLMRFLDLPEEFFRIGTSARDVVAWQMRQGHLGPVPEAPDDFERSLDARMEAFRQPGGRRYLRKAVTGTWLDVSMQPLPDGGMLAFYRDVTPIKEREEQIEAERALLRDVVNSMETFVALLDSQGGIILSNGWGRNLLSVPDHLVQPGGSLGEAVRFMYRRGDFGFDKDEETVVASRLGAVLAGRPFTVTRPAPGGRWLEFSYRPIPGSRVVAVGRDVTELKASEQAAIAARDAAEAGARAKANFLAAMSHEIRTPMNGVLGMLEVLSRGGLRDDQARTVQVMRESAESLLRIVDDVLDFSKIEAGRLEMEAVPFSLRGLVEATVETLTPAAAQRGLALFAEAPPGDADWLLGDPTRVRQILFNLVGNAVKFTERGYVRIAASSRVEGGHALVTLTVEDSGIGMGAAALARLFEPFTQGDSSTTRRFGGTGLGLSIVRRLAELMGGEVKAESEPGRGSSFTVTLRLPPAAQPGPARPPRAEAAPFQAGTQAGGVLLVDDHPVNREVISRQLELLGIVAEAAEDGARALNAWRAGRHAIVLLDIHMPIMDGFDLARAIRREEQAQGLPRTALIAVTANALKGEDERCYAAGMDGFLPKPVTMDALARALGRWVPGLAGEAQTGTLFDPEALRSLFGQDRERLSSILETFAETAAMDLSALRDAEAKPAAEIAHRLKGSARMVGARLLAERAQALEERAKAGEEGAAREAAAELQGLLQETLRAARPALG
jgi:signal transduction histidine kinase/CheY-like chemotaxis protein/HPt (histidine-containing phosphotransfer) domain-containing protein